MKSNMSAHNASTLSPVEKAYPTVRPRRRIRVLLADSSPGFQTVVAALLASEDSLEIVGSSWKCERNYGSLRRAKARFAFDRTWPVKFVGLTTAALVSGAFPQINIVLMGDYDSPRLRAKSRTSGARFFIYKPNFNPEFAQVLQTVSSLPSSYNAAKKAEGF